MTGKFPEQNAGYQKERLLFTIKGPVIYYASVLHEGSRSAWSRAQSTTSVLDCLTLNLDFGVK